MVAKRSVKKVEIADDNVVDLKFKEKGGTATANFTVHRIEDTVEPVYEAPEYERQIKSPKFDSDELRRRMDTFAEKLERAVIKVSPGDELSRTSSLAAEPKELIKVKFDKFVQLVASRDFLAILEKNRNEDIIMTSNLLTDLAGAIEEKSERKTPVIFLIGLAIGVIVTYLLINR